MDAQLVDLERVDRLEGVLPSLVLDRGRIVDLGPGLAQVLPFHAVLQQAGDRDFLLVATAQIAHFRVHLGRPQIDPAGQLLTTLAAPEMKRPKALTLDATGAVLVYDERAEKVLRYK